MDQCNLSLNSIMRKSCLGHKQVHVLKFHSFLIPEILFSNLHRAAESIQHDSSITNLNLNGTELGRLWSQILGEPMTPNCIANLNLNRTQLRRLCSLDRPFSNFRWAYDSHLQFDQETCSSKSQKMSICKSAFKF